MILTGLFSVSIIRCVSIFGSVVGPVTSTFVDILLSSPKMMPPTNGIISIAELNKLKRDFPDGIFVSNLKKKGIIDLQNKITEHLFGN
jgi:hypothetical protein